MLIIRMQSWYLNLQNHKTTMTQRMGLLLYLKTNKIKYQFMLSINFLKSK